MASHIHQSIENDLNNDENPVRWSTEDILVLLIMEFGQAENSSECEE